MTNSAPIAILNYVIKDPAELNLSYMPFIIHGGLFVPTTESFSLGDHVAVDLLLPGQKESLRIEGKVIWITPNNALHHALAGVGIQFVGPDTDAVRVQIEAHLDNSLESGGYAYGITEELKKEKK